MKKSSLLLLTICVVVPFHQMQSQEHLKKTMHKEAVHQYVVREAYNLLKARHGVVPDMDSHVGINEVGERPWQTKKIVTGAWREDVEDVVYDLAPEN